MTISFKELFRRFTEFIFGNSSDETTDIENILQPKAKESPSSSSVNAEERWETLYVPPSNDKEPYHDPIEEITNSTIVKSALSRENQSIDGLDEERLEQTDNIVKEETTDSLLDDLVGLISEMDIIKTKLNSSESKDIIQFCQERIIECMTKQSIDVFGNESFFNNEMHTPVPFQIIPNGTSINKCIRPGLKKNDKIILKALVEIDLN